MRTLGRIGVKLSCDPGREPDLCRSEGRWAVGSLETEGKEREVRGENCGGLDGVSKGYGGETYRVK